MSATSEVAILSRFIEPDEPALSLEMARLVLKWDFKADDRRRMHELLEKAKAGRLSPDEKAEVETYERVGHFISLLKAKARTSLQRQSSST